MELQTKDGMIYRYIITYHVQRCDQCNFLTSFVWPGYLFEQWLMHLKHHNFLCQCIDAFEFCTKCTLRTKNKDVCTSYELGNPVIQKVLLI